jgi:Lrp/AsnC family leucine-responsive transcriptional regulator
MPAAETDEKNQRILDELRANARLTIPELAERVGLSATPCRLRVKALEASGAIKGYTIKENISAGPQILKFMLVEATVTTRDVLEKIEGVLKIHPAVRDIYELEGRHDYLVVIDEHHKDQVKHIIKDLRQNTQVNDTVTLSVMDHIYWRDGKLP